MTTPSEPFDGGASGAEPVRPVRAEGCAAFEEVAAELALGSLTGARRSVALAHLDRCEECRSLLEDLSIAADSLLLAAPEADPSAGFEVRWLTRIREADGRDPASTEEAHRPATPIPATAPPIPRTGWRPEGGVAVRRHRRARTALVAAAALVIAGAGVGIGLAASPHRTAPVASGPIHLAMLRSSGSYSSAGTTVGEVAITTGNPAWLVMTLEKSGWSGQVRCVVDEHGHATTLGTFWLHDGAGSWSARLPSPGSAVTSAEVQDLSGSVLATATFSG